MTVFSLIAANFLEQSLVVFMAVGSYLERLYWAYLCYRSVGGRVWAAMVGFCTDLTSGEDPELDCTLSELPIVITCYLIKNKSYKK